MIFCEGSFRQVICSFFAVLSLRNFREAGRLSIAAGMAGIDAHCYTFGELPFFRAFGKITEHFSLVILRLC